jgi:hypothetical protein
MVSALNNRACELFHRKEYNAAFSVFKEAMESLKNDVDMAASGISNASITAMSSLPYTNAGLFLLHQQADKPRPHWLYSQPLWIPYQTDSNLNYAAFAITFNLALTCHLRAITFESINQLEDSHTSYQMAKKLYQLPIQVLKDYTAGRIGTSDQEYLVLVGIFNNVAHVHCALGEDETSSLYRQQLVRTVFFLVDNRSSLGLSPDLRIFAFERFLDNVHDLVCNIESAPAA